MTLLAWIRALRLVIHLLVGLLAAAAVRLDFTRRLSGERAMSWWCSVLLDILNIQLVVRGEPLARARFTVANHVSWLDMILIGACEPTRFVSKSEVRDWPIAGFLTAAAGTFYLKRGKGGAGPLIERLIPHLSNGGSVVVFPEGTTTEGRQTRPFYPRLFAAAIDAQCAVQPLAIRYGLDEYGVNVAPFVGDDDLVSHVLRILKTTELCAELTYCEPIKPRDHSRETLASQAQAAITQVLGREFRPLPEAATSLAA